MVEGPPATAIQLTRTLSYHMEDLRMAPASLIVKQFPYVMLLLPGQMPSPLSASTISRRRSSLTRAAANDLRSLSNDPDLDNVVYSVAAKPPRGSQRSCPRSWHKPFATEIGSRLAPEYARDRSLHAS